MTKTIAFSRKVPVAADVDVLVAGGGIAGCMAAVAAARNGAQTAIADRFGCLGGNMGPGMFSGGVLHLVLNTPFAKVDRLRGLPGEFIDRCEGYCDGQLGNNYLRDAHVVSHVWHTLMIENNVQMMLNAYVSDPIMEKRRVRGALVETKSGLQAVKAKVVIDATGDADVAFRAGAAMDEGDTYAYPGMYFSMGGVDDAAYAAFRDKPPVPNAEDLEWAKKIKEHSLFSARLGILDFLLSFYRQAWYLGEYRIAQEIGDLAEVTIDHGLYRAIDGTVGAQLGLRPKPGVNLRSGDAPQRNALEIGCRQYIFDTGQFLRRRVPGFKNAYLCAVSPYFHFRGGRSAVTDYVVTQQDADGDKRFDDVIFVTFSDKVASEEGYDFPYRHLLPRGLDGMLMAGRSAIVQPPSNRNRWRMLMMGQAAGLAAALAARDGVEPRAINVKELQKLLYHKYHAYMGTAERMKVLGMEET